MIKLSVAIITLNEEQNIGRCLDSVSGLADEIIVIDSGSTDNTLTIATEKGANVSHQNFLGHKEQKNFALSKCTYDHVLSLDADEALSPELKKSISDIKENWSFDGYEFNRLTNYCGKWIKHCGWYPDKKIRLFDKTKGKWEGINPHDKFEVRTNRIGFLHGDILHYSYYTIDQHKKQIELFTTIAAEAMFKAGKKTNALQILFSPVAKFMKSYFLQLGILDGVKGLFISWLSAGSRYKKYRKLMQLQS